MELAYSFPKTERLVYARLKAGKGSDPDARLKLRCLGIDHLGEIESAKTRDSTGPPKGISFSYPVGAN